MAARLCRHRDRAEIRRRLRDLAADRVVVLTVEVPAVVRMVEVRADRMEVPAGTDQDITDKKFLSQPKHDRRVDSERSWGAGCVFTCDLEIADWNVIGVGGTPAPPLKVCPWGWPPNSNEKRSG